MKILILAVGQKQPAWVDAAMRDYLARFPADFKVELRELKAEARTGRADEAERCRSAEFERLRSAVPAGSQLVALDERGKDWTTQQLAEQLRRWRELLPPQRTVPARSALQRIGLSVAQSGWA